MSFHFFTIYFPGFACLCFSRPKYQVSNHRTIGPLVLLLDKPKLFKNYVVLIVRLDQNSNTAK